MNPRRVSALCAKEARQIVRDPSSVLIAFVLPALLMFLYGYGVSLDMENLRVGIVLEDTAPPARDLARTISASAYFEADVAPTRQAFAGDLESGKLRGLVVIPQDFSARLAEGRAEIQTVADGSEPNTANFVRVYTEGAVQTWLELRRARAERAETGGPVMEQRMWFNEEVRSRNFLIPGSIAIILTLIGTLLTALVVAREWERGTMEALMATPVTIGEILAGKLLPYLGLGLGSTGVSYVLARVVFDVPYRGSLLVLGLVAAVFLAAALGVGLLISTLARNQFVASQMALLTAFLPAFLLSGFLFEISSMPPAIRLLTHIVPARYLVPCLQTVFLAGDVWPLLLPNLGSMLLMAAILFTITWRKSAKKLD
ncbi:ABC transporter permease [Desulfohalovibrio reitneri]|uniref:ABC transporter permease n=1 Tax=Desulfohalovibrio reitneri TaxID=1307759 RepID=UPI0004A71B6D|nr:ABC transporter permease [Desulfohalovibrio reitneri]